MSLSDIFQYEITQRNGYVMATIEVMGGPMAGRIYEIFEANVIFGRDARCDVRLGSSMVSRQHAQILSKKNNYFLEDLNSRNGTYLNGRLLKRYTRLVDGDRVQICDIPLVFHNEISYKQTAVDRSSQSNKRQNRTSVLFANNAEEDSTFIRSAYNAISLSSAVASEVSADVKLRALLEVMHNLGNVLDLDKLLANLLNSLFKIFALADRGFIVMNNKQGILEPRWTKVRNNEQGPLRISRVIIDHVMNAKEAVLSEDAANDQRFDSSKSILAYKIHSVICAPLINSDGQVFGVLQVDSFDRTQRFNDQDLEVLASVAAQAAIAINNAQLHEYSLEQRVMERDLELAHQVQQSFLPEQQPDVDGYCFYHFYKPAKKVGGDFFDYIALPDGRIAVIVADVAGHGVAAALVMVKLSAHVRFCISGEIEPDRVLNELNAIFCRSSLDDRFITFVMTIINPVSHEVIVVNAGHMAPVIRHKTGIVEHVGGEVSGVPLGIVPEFSYQSAAIVIQPGDLIALYTDGINESQNEAKEFYGEKRIEQVMSLSNADAAAFGTSLINDLQKFCKEQPYNDDITLVAFSRKD